jgi:hypothetical protein
VNEETKHQNKCLKLLHAELVGAVVIKHSEGFTSGVPDVSVTWQGKTSWWEFKHGATLKWANGLQQLTCRRLAAAGVCHVVFYSDVNGIKTTQILTPDETIVASVENFDHRFILGFVKVIHLASEPTRLMPYRVVNTDNFGGDYPNESFVDGEYETQELAQAAADKLNVNADISSRYFKVVKLPYELQPGFEP